MLGLSIVMIMLVAASVAAVFALNALIATIRTGLPYVTTPDWAIDWLTKNLSLSPTDVVYELGCGDARVLCALAKKYPETTFIGVELQWWPYLLAQQRARGMKNVIIQHSDFLKMDLSPATVAYGFYITVMAPKIGAKLARDLQPGARAISYGFALPGLKEIETIQNPNKPNGSKIRIYRKG